MRAAPTARLVSSAPYAPGDRSSDAATSGCCARRSLITKQAVATAPSGSSHSAAGEIAPVEGSSAEKLTMIVESAMPRRTAPGQSTAAAIDGSRRTAINARVD